MHMAWTVDVNFVNAYTDTLVHLFSEDPQQVRNAVRLKTGVVGKTLAFDRLGGVNMEPVNSRHADTPLTPLTQTRRRANLADWATAELIDKLDEVKMLIAPQNDYTRRFVEAYHRRVARTVLNAATGTASAVGNDDTVTSVSLPSSQAIANGGTGFTVAKVRQTNRIMDNAGVPHDGNRWWAVSAYAIEDLLADSQVTSSDFSTLNALMNGGIPMGSSWMGFRWIVISDADPDSGSASAPASPILSKSGNIRTTVAWHKEAVGLAIAKDLSVEVDRRPDKMNAQQVLVQVSLGAVRIEDTGVVTVDLDESV
jgi:hypothetical protein